MVANEQDYSMNEQPPTTKQPPATCRVECFMRAPTGGTRPPEEAVVERLRRLEAAGRITDHVWHVWNSEVCLSSPADRTASSRVAIAKYEEFRRWAARHDRRLTPFFAERTVASSVTDEEYELVTFPVICVAVYDTDADGDAETLRDLAPTADRDRTYSVQDCLDAIERADRRAERPRGADPTARS